MTFLIRLNNRFPAHPGIPQSGICPDDTLVVTFSEPVSGVACPDPFLFSRNGLLPSDEYQMSLSVLKNTGDQWFFTVTTISGVEFPSTGDYCFVLLERA